jgi:hypothetical protein
VNELQRALRLANARVAAWRLQGVPIKGEFTVSRSYPSVVRFSPLCAACKKGYPEGDTADTAPEDNSAEVLLLALWYRGVSRWVLSGCPHFGALLGPEPPEVTGLIKLLFLEDPSFGGDIEP